MEASSAENEFSLWELMHVGSNLASLRYVTARTPIKATRLRPISIPDQLRLLQTDLETFELPQSEDALLDKCEDLLGRLEQDDRRQRLGSDAFDIRSLSRRVEQVLVEEANRRSTFVVQRTRKGEIEDLLRSPTVFFGVSEDGPLELSAIGVDDFTEAAKCYSIGLAAASMMFMLRGTEEVLRGYYHKVTQQSSRGAWANLLNVLRIPVLNCPGELISLLGKLKNKRNEAMHPERRNPSEWDIDAARGVLDDCRKAIRLMIEDLETRSA